MTLQEAIEIITNAIQTDNMTVKQDKALAIIQKALEKQIPQKTIYHKEKYDHHTWKKTTSGKIDDFAMENGFCNGPMCEVCGYSFCEHCENDGYKNTNCTVQYYSCPTCGCRLHDKPSNKYCEKCGQALDWSDK